MPVSPFDRVRPGLPPLAEQTNALFEAVEELARIDGPALARSPAGTSFAPGLPDRIEIRITAAPPAGSGSGSCSGGGAGSGSGSGTGLFACGGYSFVQVVRYGCNWVVPAAAVVGGPCVLPAYERNDNPFVPVGTRVEAVLAADHRSYVFSCERGRFVTDVGCDGTNPTLDYD
jgi:hypothetical protein